MYFLIEMSLHHQCAQIELIDEREFVKQELVGTIPCYSRVQFFDFINETVDFDQTPKVWIGLNTNSCRFRNNINTKWNKFYYFH